MKSWHRSRRRFSSLSVISILCVSSTRWRPSMLMPNAELAVIPDAGHFTLSLRAGEGDSP